MWPGHVTSARDQLNPGFGLSRTPAEPSTSQNQACSTCTSVSSPPEPPQDSITQRVERLAGCSGLSGSPGEGEEAVPGSEPEEQQEAGG